MIDNTLTKLFTLHLPLKDVTEFGTSEHIWKYDNMLNRRSYYTLEKDTFIWFIYRHSSLKYAEEWTLSLKDSPYVPFNNKFFFTRKGAIKYMTKLGLVDYIRNI